MYFFLKRALDILLSGIALLLLLPFLIPIMLLLRLTGEGEVFYGQERVGRQGRKFKLLKFVTMLKNSPSIGTRTITTKNDPRVLPLGRFLRKTKINELPQLINVLKGDMSIVGPRPLTTETFSFYSDEVQKVVIQNQPGLTGIGSIVFRDEEAILNVSGKSAHDVMRQEIAPYKGALETWYDRKKSMPVDLGIILLTALAIINPASQLHYRWFPDLPRKSLAHRMGEGGPRAG